MKWIAYCILICAVVDIVAMELAVRDGTDVMFPGVIVIILAPVILYSIITIIIANMTRWADKWPVLMFFWLSPGYLFVFLHPVMIPLMIPGLVIKGVAGLIN